MALTDLHKSNKTGSFAESSITKTGKGENLQKRNMLTLARWPFVIMIICTIIIGIVFMIYSAQEAEQSMKQIMLLQARMLVESIDQERFLRLTATPADELSPDYHYLRSTLIRIRAANPDYQYLYLMGKQGNNPPFFYMGTAQTGTDEYSPPGQPYHEEAPALEHVFQSGEATISDPVTDRWGTWISALVPLRDQYSGQMLAVFGMDINVSDWKSSIFLRALLPGILTVSIVFLLLLLYFVIRNRQRARAEHLLLEQNRILEIQTIQLKKTSEELHLQKDRYRFILEGTNVGTWEWNVQTGETIYNERLANMVGYTLAELSPISFKTWESLVHPDDLKTCNDLLKQHFDGKTDFYECECRMKHKDSHWVWVLDKGKVITRTEEGKPLLAYGTHQDITERKQAEAELLAQREQLKSIAANVPGVVYQFYALPSDEYGITYVSKRAVELFELQGNTETFFTEFLEHVHPEDRNSFLDSIRKAVDTVNPWQFEGRFVKNSGDVLWFSGSSNPIKLHDRIVFNGLLFDITEQKRVEEAMEKRIVALTQPLDRPEEVNFEDLFNINELQQLQDEFAQATNVASIITHPDGTPITKPSNFCRLCIDIIRKTEIGCVNCFKSDALLGRLRYDRPTVQPCLSGGLWDAGAAITVGGRHIANWLIGQVRDEEQTEEKIRAYARIIGVDEDTAAEAYYEVPSMSHQKFEKIALALFTLAKQLSNFAYQNIQQARFITERKQAEEIQAKLTEQLHQSQKMDAIGQLAGGVAHDFNNLLGAIIGSTQLIQIPRNLSKEQNEYLSIILTAAERAGNLTKKLLTFSRSGTKTSTAIDCIKIVKDTLEILQHTIDKNIAITMENRATQTSIIGDDSLLQNALINMGVNASHAMPQGGKLTFSLENLELDRNYCEVSPFAIKPGSYLEIAVRDTGYGITSDVLPRIFEPFFTTKENGKGTGLGLAMVYGTVQEHGGAITVYSEVGTGTVFHIYLPLTEESTHREKTAEELPTGTATILLIDDEELIRITAKGLLESLGYKVLLAENGEEGVNAFSGKKDEIDLIILDMIMPVMGGREAFEKLRKIDPDISILIASGFAKEENMILLKEQGLSGFLQKPFRITELAVKISDILK